MRISWNWLKNYIQTDISPEKAAEILTSTGLEVESVELHEPIKGMLRGVIVGHVKECKKHPDADRLSVCTVDLGEGDPVQIVCGAPNVAADQKVLVATVGADLCMNDGTCIVIKKSKIRGQDSNGMICAEDELGLGQNHDGILILHRTAVVGTPAVDQIGLKSDHLLEIGLTPNRTDAMGHIGVARDLVAALVYRTGADVRVKWPTVDAFKKDTDGTAIEVTVQNSDACPRYAGVTLADIKVGPSPEWLKNALNSIGLKPINNVVDVTNYVQHETGQPLHVFDAAKLNGGKIVVRMANDNEPFRTLDEKDRVMHGQDLVIADVDKPVCIAGVFGGSESGVTNSTTSIFLESAFFDPTTIRRTARRHGLSTDASFRFERGVDPELTVYALKRAALLLKEVAGATIVSDITDLDNRQKRDTIIDLKFAYCDALTGISIAHKNIVQLLELLDFTILEKNTEGLRLKAPLYRTDVTRPADVVEEILRIHGFDQVPLPDRLLAPPIVHDALTLESLRERTGQHLATRGFREIMAPSLTKGERAELAVANSGERLVAMANPLSAELNVLRPTMLFGALQAVAHNINRQQRDLRFFERGRVYAAKENGTRETESMALTITGERLRERWRSKNRKTELADLKEELEALFERMGLNELANWSATEHALLSNAFLVEVNNRLVGHIGQVKTEQLKAFDVGQPVFYAELAESVLLSICKKQTVSFTEVSKFPLVKRDLSLLVDNTVKFETLKKTAQQAERKLLNAVDLFDVYEGDKLPKGKKSYALRFILQDTEKTLTDEVVEKSMGRIRKALENEVGAELRG